MPENNGTRPARRPSRILKALLALVFCLAVGWLGAVAARPFVLAARMRAENAKIEREILAMKQENQNLRKSIAALNTDAGREREARRLGYVRVGEVRLLIP
jgi:cell division protein FtsB